MEIERIDFMDAIKVLAERWWLNLDEYLDRPDSFKETRSTKEQIKRMNKLAQQTYVSALDTADQVQLYLTEKRKLTPVDIKHFGLWYAPDVYDSIVWVLRDKKFEPDAMIEWWLAKRSAQTAQMYDFFRHRLTIPLYDPLWNIVWFGARALSDDQKWKYINTPETPLYDKSSYLYGLNRVKQWLKQHPFVIVVEWYMDVIALHRAWYPIAVAACGTSLTKQHIDLLLRYTQTVYFLFDDDSAWVSASMRALQTAYERQLFPKVLTMPWEGKDVDDLVNEHGEKAQEVVQHMIDTAQDGLTRAWTALAKNHDKNSVSGRQKLSHMLFDLIHAMHNVTMQTFSLQWLAQQLWMQYEYIVPEYTQYTKQEQRQKRFDRPVEKTTLYKPEKKELTAVLFKDWFGDSVLGDDVWRDLIKRLLGEQGDQDVDESLQLRREDQRKDSESERDKSQSIFLILKEFLHTSMKERLKMLPWEQKGELMKTMQELVKYYGG